VRGGRLRTLRDNAIDWLRRDELDLAERTPYELVHQDDIHAVRHYPPLREAAIEVQGASLPVARETHAVPLVLVAPLAATMRIYDLFPNRSLVRYLLARGFRVYLVDWGRPERRHDRLDIAAYVGRLLPEALAAVRRHSGSSRLSLHGWSFGGLFALCCAALGEPGIVNLALLGSPCDYHANGLLGRQYQLLSKQLRFLERTTGLGVHHTRRAWWRAPGWANSLAFKLISPVATAQGYVELLRNLHDREFVAAHATNAAFLDDMTAYPGGVMRDIVRWLLKDNVLASGRLPVSGCQATLADVNANLLCVAGADDTIVTRACTAPLLSLVSSVDKRILDVRGGHMGILGGSRAPASVWKPVADWLAARSD
jgi:polyhydroxyalkanoate synthase